MKPTQEQILSALNKLVRENKTELKAEKIELGIAEDFKGILKASNNNFKNSEKMVSEASTINDIAFKILM